MYNSLPCAELVDQTAQRPNVAFDVVRLTINELRRHVVRRLREPRWRLGREGARLIRGTHSDVGLCHGRLRHRLAEPEVAKLEVVIPIEEDWVLRISTHRRSETVKDAPFSGLMSRWRMMGFGRPWLSTSEWQSFSASVIWARYAHTSSSFK